MKRSVISKAAVRQAALRSTRESAALERRTVPSNYVRSAKVGRFVESRRVKR